MARKIKNTNYSLLFIFQGSIISSMKKNVILVVMVLMAVLLAGCSGGKEIPKQKSALDQFYYAMETYYFPASYAEGEKQKRLAKKAADSLKAVWTYFPESEEKLVLMEAHFYQGMSLRQLEEPEKAGEAFYACYSFDVPGTALNDHDMAMISYKDESWNALMELREYLPDEYLNEIDIYEP